MTNLPIASNSPQSPTMGTHGDATQSSPKPSEGRATGDVTSAGARNASSTTSKEATGTANDQTTEPFSVVLARQISEAGSPVLDSKQISTNTHGKTATDDADQTAKAAVDQTTTAATITGDTANSLATVLMQIPVQQTDAPSRNTPAVDATLLRGDPSRLSRDAGVIKQKIEDGLKRTADISTGAANMPTTIADRQKTDPSALIPLSTDAVKHLEMTVSSTGQSQPGQHTTKAASLAAASAVMPNLMTSDIHTETLQTITTTLSNNGWADEFSQKIVWMSNQQNQIAELHLNPPDLGPLNVVLKLSDNQLTAQFTSPHSAVRDAVENALPKLREILADNNITLGNATVSDQATHDRSAEGFMNQGSGTAAQREAAFNATESNRTSTTTPQGQPASRHNGMLDIFA